MINLKWYEWMPLRWKIEQDIAHRYLTELSAGITRTGWAVIKGKYALRSDCGHVRDVYDLRIVYPHDYLPVLPSYFHWPVPLHPNVFLDSHRDVWQNGRDSHIEHHWRLCLYVPGESQIDLRLPNSLERVFEAVHLFLIRERMYQRDLARESETGVPAKWPGPDRAHGVMGLWEAVRERGGMDEDEPCICGSGRAFRSCHSNEIALIDRGVAA